MESFTKLGISEKNTYPLSRKGFTKPTEIQELTIPILLNKEIDLIAQAQTGTGKTAAFGLTLIERLEENNIMQALILAPTRELVVQICDEINSLKGSSRLSIIPIYGGQSIDLQFKKLKKGVNIVVGTPGRILDHLNRGTLELNNLKYFILDEADEMLNMGFIEDIETIFKLTPEKKRVFLFSATMPHRIQKLAEHYMGDYEFIKTNTTITTNLTTQIYHEIMEDDKFEALCRIIDINPDFYGLIFCQTKIEVDQLANKLIERSYSSEPLHGDLSQYQRERTLEKFKKKYTNVLVATDVAARGLDINDLTHVINYSVPQNPEIYVHRIGRTGRAGKTGTSITFVTPSDFSKMDFIKRIVKSEIKREDLPQIDDILNLKKDKITDNIKERLNYDNSDFHEWAKELLGIDTPEEVVASILKNAYGKFFDKKNYKEIKAVKGKRERVYSEDNKVRLFVAKGKLEGMTKRKIIDFISAKSGTPERKFEQIQLFDNFSFITVPGKEADMILHSFKNIKNNSKPIIEKAKAATKKVDFYEKKKAV